MAQPGIGNRLASFCLALGTLCAASPPTQAADRSLLQREADSLAALLVPAIAQMDGFRESRPVENEIKTKEDLKQTVVNAAREYYGPDGFKKEGRVAAALGLLPQGYDLETGTVALLIELMGGGYDPLRKKIYVLADLPSSATEDPSVKRMIAAHEITHALQDQNGDMVSRQRQGILDWDFGYTYNCILEGMAYLTMMAIRGDTTLAAAADPTDMLVSTRAYMEKAPEFKEYSIAPLYLTETIFGRGLHGIAFCRAILRDRPGTRLAGLLDSLPASGEQILHFEKYKEGDCPASIDLSSLPDHLPRDWQSYFASNLGEFQIRVLFASHEATRESASQIAGGWDGCQFRTFEDAGGRLVLLGLSSWDTEVDAQEFAAGFRQVLADVHDSTDYAVEQDGNLVRFVIDPEGAGAKREGLDAIAAVQPAKCR